MSAVEFLCQVIGVNAKKLSRYENLILEADLFNCLYTELKKLFRDHLRDYFQLLNLNQLTEDAVLDNNFIRYLVEDILNSKAYTVDGLCVYAEIPEEVLHDILIGRNTNPTLHISRKIIEIHKGIRPELYRAILMKVAEEVSVAA